MSDLDLAKSKLIDTIGHYNATASNIQKFRFNQLETNVFATMMVEFAKELANEDSKQPKKALDIQGVVGSVLLTDLLKESQEVIAINGLRFTGTHEEAIKNVFNKHGINYEQPF